MMAHNVSAHPLSSALPHRSSSYPNQDQLKVTSRHIPILSVPEILDAFQPTHSSSNSNIYGNPVFRSTGVVGDPWDLPELKWLDGAENVVLGPCENLADIDKYPEQATLAAGLVPGDKPAGAIDGGERWPFPALYPGDRVAAANCGSTLDDCFAQFSLPPMMNLSPADSGTSALTKNATSTTRRSSSSCLNTTSDFQYAVSQPPPHQQQQQQQKQKQQASEWRRNTSSASASCNSGGASQLRPAASEKPDSDLSQGKSKSDRSNISSKAGAFDGFLQGTASSSDLSALAVPIPRLDKKRKHQSSTGLSACCDVGSSKPKSSTTGAHVSGGDTKASVGERGVASGTKTAAVNDRHGSSGREAGKKSVSAAPASTPGAPAAATAAGASISAGGASASPGGAAASDHDIHIWTERERRKKMNGMFSTLHALLPHLTTKADKATIVDEAINYIQSLQQQKGVLERKVDAAASEALTPSSSFGVLQALTAPTTAPSSLAAIAGGSSEADTVVIPAEVIPLCDLESVELDIKPSAAALQQSGDSTLQTQHHQQQQQRDRTESQDHEFQTLSTPNVVLNVCGMDVVVTICTPRENPGLLCRVLFAMETHGLHVLTATISTTDDTAMYMFHTQTADSNDFSNPDTRSLALRDLTSCLSRPDNFKKLAQQQQQQQQQQQPSCTTSTRCNSTVQMPTTT